MGNYEVIQSPTPSIALIKLKEITITQDTYLNHLRFIINNRLKDHREKPWRS